MASPSRNGPLFDAHLLDLLPTGVCVCGVDGVIQRYNRRAVELWGREPRRGEERFCGSLRLFRPDGTPLQHQHSPVAEVLRRGVPQHNVEVVIERPDGFRITVLVNIAPLRDEAGALVGAVNVFQDVSERKGAEQSQAQRVEAALRASEERFRLLVEGTTDYAIFLLDPEGRVVSWNPGAERINGYRAEEIVGQHFSRFYPPEDVRAGKPGWDLKEAEAAGRFEEEGWRLRKDGSRFWASVVLTALRDEAGRLRGFSKITRDVTARKEAEENARRLLQEQAARSAAEASAARRLADAQALRRGQERLNLAQRAARMGTFEWVVDTGEVVWTRELEALYGLDPGAFDGTYECWKQAVHPEDRDRAEAEVLRAAADRTELNTEFRVLLPDGTLRWIAAHATLDGGSGGEPLRMIGVNMDVTARKEAELALREADQRKDEFLALLGHELRNPLAPMRNALQVLRLRVDAGTVEWAGGILERQLQHLARMVDDLLDVSRIGRGKIRLEQRRLDLVEVVRATAEDHRRLFEGAGLALEVDLPAGPVWVRADLTRLSQVLGNLLTNAFKFTDKGGRVLVRLTQDSVRPEAVVAVRDTGIGIEPEMLPRVFDPFAQADRSLDRSRTGLGLGLALVKGLVELHGGEVRADSPGPGQGSEFSFRLPTAPQPAPPDPGASLPAGAGRRLRVLVVEDNQDGAESLRVLLGLLGHEVRVAHTGPEGIEEARRHGPDLVLCDLGLPGMDGYGVARALRQDPTTAGIRLIAMSGYGSLADRQRCLEAGFEVLLTKPVEPNELQRLLLPEERGERGV